MHLLIIHIPTVLKFVYKCSNFDEVVLVLGLRVIIELKIVEILSNVEKNPHQAYTENIISDFLHGGEHKQVNLKNLNNKFGFISIINEEATMFLINGIKAKIKH